MASPPFFRGHTANVQGSATTRQTMAPSRQRGGVHVAQRVGRTLRPTLHTVRRNDDGGGANSATPV